MAGVVAGVAIWKMRDTALSDFTAKSQQELELFGFYIDQMLSNATFTAEGLARSPVIKGSMGKFPTFRDSKQDTPYKFDDLPPDAKAIATELRNMQESNPNYREVFIGYKDGGYAMSFAETLVPAGTDMSKRSWYLSCTASPKDSSLGEVYQNIKGDMVVCTTTKVKDADGQLIGVLGIDLALTNLTETIGKMRLGDSGRFILIEHTGRLICSPQTPDLVGKVIGKDFRHEALERLQNSPDGLYRIPIGNTDVMAMSITTPFGWKMAFVEDVAEIFSSADEAMSTIAVVSLLITLVMIALGLVLVRTITRPLDLLVGYANEVAAGKLEAKVDAGHFFGELARLHQALEDMLNNLRKFISESRQQTEEAEEARKRAENAKREGMFNAANQLTDAVGIISSTSTQLARQVEESTSGAEQQAHRAMETATAMNEMNATVLEVAKNAGQAAEMSSNMRHCADEGADIVRQVVKGIEDVQSISLTLKEDMAQLGENARSITQIMSVISDIADQTNLLALNAAIEAARAGEAGRGFAVVADEVRKLAEKTMSSTSEVGNAINAIRNSTEKSIRQVDVAVESIARVTELSNKSGQALEQIVNMAEQSADEVRAIATAGEQQSATSEEINRSIADINSIATSTSKAMQQAAQAISELARQAQHLNSVIEDMKRA